MEAVVVTAHGGPEVLELQQRDDLSPGPGQVLVDVAASGVNFMDTYLRRGVLLELPTPFVLGVDGAGVVTAVGEGVESLAPGDRVVWERVMGSYADQVLVPEGKAHPVPDDLDLAFAAAGLMQALTAHHLAYAVAGVGEGTAALVHSAGSGVGRMLTQMVGRAGGRVIATVSRPEKVDAARQAGADEVLVRDGPDLAARVRELTEGRGVDVAFDGTGAPCFEASVASVAWGGTFVHFGQAGGPIPPLDLWEQPDGVRLTYARGAREGEGDEETAPRAQAVLEMLAADDLSVLIGDRYPLAEARRAHEDIESQATVGKLLLVADQ